MSESQKELLAFLNYAQQRLRIQARSCEGTICDDEKVWALEREADAIAQARGLLLGAFR